MGSSSGSTLVLLFVCCFTWCLFNVGSSQLQSFQSQVLLQLKKHLEYPKQLEMWYDHGTDFCSLPQTSQVNITCNFNSVTELKITGDHNSSEKFTIFRGFAIPNKTLSETFSIESFVTTLTRLSSLKTLSLVSLGIWGPLPDKIHRLSSLEYLDLSSNFLFGSIPPKLSTFVKLQVLVLDDNFFNGTELGFLTSLSNLSTLSLKNNELSGKLPDLNSVSNLRVLGLSNNSFSGIISSQFVNLYQLQHIELSYNKLSGAPLAQLFSLPNISYLNLASNTLLGAFPENLTCSSNLNFIDISDNRLTGGLPSCLRHESDIRVVKFSGNCLSVDGQSQHDVSYCREDMNVEVRESKGKGEGKGKLLGIIFGISVVVVVLASCFLLVYRRCCIGAVSEQHLLRKAVQDNSTSGFSSEFISNARFMPEKSKLGSQLPASRSFTLEELKKATNNFDNSYILGEGSYGKLYKGKLENEMSVAIRCLPSSKRYSIRNLKLRLDMLAKIRHPNLVGVIGHCIDGVSQEDHYSVNRVFLVYEYVSNGNFRAHLSDNGLAGETLKWSERLAVLTGVAKAVHFLHTGVIPGFFNNRLKTNNILLNEHKMAKLCDYGLSIIPDQSVNHKANGGEDHMSWQMKRLEDDVCSFGLILLESLVGSSMATKKEGFLRQTLASLGNQEGQGSIISPIVMATSSQESLSIIISITCKCISLESWSRPTFEDILWNLQSAAQAHEKTDSQRRR